MAKPISQEAVLAALETAGRDGLSLQELERALGLSRSQRSRLKDALTALHERGKAFRGARRRWRGVRVADGAAAAANGHGSQAGRGPDAQRAEAPAESPSTGTLRVFPSGRSDIRPDDGGAPVRVHRLDRGSGIDGDRVRYEAWDDYGGIVGRVQAVTERGRTRVTGRLVAVGSAFLIEPDDPRIPQPVDVLDAGGAQPGEAVVANILQWPKHPDDGLQVRVTQRLGDPEDPRTEVRKLLLLEDIEETFPPEVDAQLAGLRLPNLDDLPTDRSDLRNLPFFTIDPGDARDFDDAVCVVPKEGADRLHVAVADVSYYVRAGTPLDKAAAHRALSVYLPDRAVHMLPPQLATRLCSLSPGEDRFAMVVSMTVSAAGEVSDAQVTQAVIRSRERLTYEGVARVLAGGSDALGPSDAWREELAELTRVAGALRRRRLARGGLDLDLPEAHVVLDEDDPLAVRDVRPAKPDPWIQEAYRLIEECMVAANEAVGQLAERLELPVLWRVHDPPTGDRWAALAQLAEELGMPLSLQGGPTPRFFQRILRKFLAHPARGPLQVALLRCLSQATYEADNRGHFALAAPAYVHFTSPIRRYPDLVTHRAIKHHLAREAGTTPTDPAPLPTPAELRQIATRCSEAERRAVDVERGVTDMYRAFVLRDRLGDVFEATITGVAPFGLFVQVDSPFVEGLIKREALGRDRWDVSPGGAMLVGERSGRRFRLGDRLRVRLLGVSVALRQVDFELEDPPADAPGERRRSGRRGGAARRSERGRRRSGSRGGAGGRSRSGEGPRGGGGKSQRRNSRSGSKRGRSGRGGTSGSRSGSKRGRGGTSSSRSGSGGRQS